jgi:GntR family transcriptional regulator
MSESPQYRPLYRQVYDVLVKRFNEGTWRAAQALPSEQALAAELGVSQGTVRKALDALESEKLVERRQGKGTYVAEHTQESSLFRFFRLATPEGRRAAPTSADCSVKRRPARPAEAEKLQLREGAAIVEITRTRLVDGHPAVLERIVVPAALLPGIEHVDPMPNTLYQLYQRDYGITIVTAREQLRADIARREDCRRLGVQPGAPLLNIERIGVGLDGTLVEWRVSRCDTSRLVYAVDLT